MKELTPSTNEAKQILAYYYDEATNEKKLIFTKFFFFLKNHKFYNKNFKNEKVKNKLTFRNKKILT